MREILFRGQTPITKKLIYGTGLLYDGVNTWIVNNEPPNSLAIGETRSCVIPETIGQYTGLTDKNGKKIFEGDILEFSDRVVEVFWHTHLGCWDTNFIKFTTKENGRDDMSPCRWDYRAEVIGNIHDNPELLKEREGK